MNIPQDYRISPFLLLDSEYFYTLRINYKSSFDCKNGQCDTYIEKLDYQFQPYATIGLTMPPAELCKRPVIRDIFLHDDKFLIFTVDHDLPSMTYRSFLFSFNMKGDLISQPLFMGEIRNTEKSSQITESSEENDFFKMIPIYTDNDFKLLYIQSFPPGESPQLKLNIKLLNSNTDEVFSKQLVMPFIPEYCKISKVLLYTNELLFMVSYSFPFEDIIYKLVTYNILKDEIAYYNFSLENKKIQSIGLDQTEGGNIYIYGYYSEEKKNDEVDGLFLYLFDQNNQEVITQSSTKIMTGNYKTIRKKDLKNLVACDLYQRDNGDVIFLSELSWTEFVNFTDSQNKFYFKPFYHSDHILVMCFTSDGNLKWQDWIPKSQFLPSQEYTGFKCIMADSSLYLFFNDHPKNDGIYDPDQIRPVKSKLNLTITRIDLNTGIYRKETFNKDGNKKEGMVFRKAYTFQINNKALVMIENSPWRLIKFTFAY
ncbi:MAG: hypothetical protein NT175_08855 [Bacteroidetes bacterium]|nr:hypothetical protein [Bacteroidota bacterium]